MTTKEYLKQVYNINKIIDANLIQLSELRKKIGFINGIDYSKDKIQSGHGNSLENSIVKLADLERKIDSKIDYFVGLKTKIECEIGALPETNERMVLTYRYLCFLSWEEIAVKMGYSYRNIHRVHAKALKDFERWHTMS